MPEKNNKKGMNEMQEEGKGLVKCPVCGKEMWYLATCPGCGYSAEKDPQVIKKRQIKGLKYAALMGGAVILLFGDIPFLPHTQWSWMVIAIPVVGFFIFIFRRMKKEGLL